MIDDEIREFIELDDLAQRGFGCLFPGECCMTGMHLTSECHTAAHADEHYEGENQMHKTTTSRIVLQATHLGGEWFDIETYSLRKHAKNQLAAWSRNTERCWRVIERTVTETPLMESPLEEDES